MERFGRVRWGGLFLRYDRDVIGQLGAREAKPVKRRLNRHTFVFLAFLSLSGFAPELTRAHSTQELDVLATPQESRIDRFRNAEIKQLQLVLTRSSAREQKPDLLLHLAALYTEQYPLYI